MTDLQDATHRRDSRLRRGMASALLFRIASGLGPLVTVPLGLHQLGKESYGIWMIAAGLTAFFAFADLGLGNAVMSRLSALQVSDGARLEIRSILSSAYAALTAVTALAAIVAITLWATVPLPRVLGTDSMSPDDRLVVLVCVLVFLLNVPASLIVRVLFGMQMAGTSYLWQTAGPLLSVCLMLVSMGLGSSDPVFVLCAVSGPLIVNILCTTWFFASARPDLRPTWFGFSSAGLRDIMGVGGLFLVVSVLMALSNAMDLLLIPRFLGLNAVADFSIAWRVLAQVGLLLSLASIPFWPAAGDALARGEIGWVKSRVRRMMAINVALIAVPSICLTSFGPGLIDTWLGQDVSIDRTLLAGLCCWWLIMAAMYPMFMVQNSMNVIWPQILGWLAFVVVCLVVKVGGLAAGLAMEWLPWISSAIYVVTVLPSALHGYSMTLAAQIDLRGTTVRSDSPAKEHT